MSSSLSYSVLTRLLTLNNQVHDLEIQLLGEAVLQRRARPNTPVMAAVPSRIAQMQEEIDRGVRASLTTCWLGSAGEPED